MVQGVYGFRSGKSVSVSHRGITKTLLFETTVKAKEALEKIKRVSVTNDSAEIASLFQYFEAGSIYGDHHGVFERGGSNGQWFLKGYTIPIPFSLVERINLHLQEGAPIESLINFWMLCMANPDSRARNDLFSFADRYNFPITPYGYFVGYKSVYVKNNSNGSTLDTLRLEDIEDPYVASLGGVTLCGLDDDSIDALKRNSSLWLVEDNNGEKHYFITGDVGDNAAEFLDSIEDELFNITEIEYDEDYDENVHTEFSAEYLGSYKKALDKVKTISGADESDSTFTDIHTRTFTIKLGEVVSMARHLCDSDPERTCSSGLHIGAPGYVKDFGGGYERRIIACLVNPAHVVAVPVDYSFEKMRVCEYFPYAISNFDNADNLNEIDTQFYESDYIGYEMEQLKQDIAKYSGELELSEAADVKRNRLSVISFH